MAAYGTLVGICRLRRGFLFPEGMLETVESDGDSSWQGCPRKAWGLALFCVNNSVETWVV